jgi:spore coat protein CotF
MEEKIKHIRLTSLEMTNLWFNYMNDSMASCVFKHFLETVEEPEVRSVIEYALHLSEQHIRTVTEILNQEGFPIPQGFKDEDVNPNAPSLFSDTFYLVYLQNMSRVGMQASSVALPGVARADIRDFYNECINSSTELNNRVTQVMLEKGIYIRAPYITVPEGVDFVSQKGYLTGWLADRRALDGFEITNLYYSVLTNTFSKALFTGFSQVAPSKDVRDFMIRGKDIAQKHIEVFHSLLAEADLPTPSTWDGEVLSSTALPFSEKLMMFHTKALTQGGIDNYGMALSTSRRRDLGVHFSRLIAEFMKLGEDGLNIMVNHGWLEQPPQVDDREAMAKGKDKG